jgi:hypothetical protein
MRGGLGGRVGRALSGRNRAGDCSNVRLGRIDPSSAGCVRLWASGPPQASQFLTRSKHEDHGGPQRKKIWRFARSAFTRFRPDIYFVGFYCPVLSTPRQSSRYGSVFAGFLRDPPWASCFLRVKDSLACLRVRTCPGRWISWPGRGSHTRPGSHTQPGATAGTGACRRAAA